MNTFSNLPIDPFQLKVFAIKHAFIQTITYDPERESYTFTVEKKLGCKLPNGGKIEFWAVGDQNLKEALYFNFKGQVVRFFERQGDKAMADYALSLLNS